LGNNLFDSKDFEFFKGLITGAAGIAHGIQRKNVMVERKADSSIVTQADLQVQDHLISKISERYSNVNFIYEENFDTARNEIQDDTVSVIIDPIDGTAVFSMYLPLWCVSIGVFRGYEPVYGFVCSPGAEMLFHNDNEHAYLNNRKLSINRNIEIDTETNIFLASEIPWICSIDFPGKIRNLGSTAMHACLIADNSRNRSLAFIGKSYLWDWAGAIPIIIRAGGSVRYISGKEIDYSEIARNGYGMSDYLVAYAIEDFSLIQRIFKME